MNGRYGFTVLFSDGRRISERDVLWDEVERGTPIAALALYDFERELQLLELTGYEKFFFANEAVSAQAMQVAHGSVLQRSVDKPVLSAKLLGGVNGNLAIEVRIDMLGSAPRMSKRELLKTSLPFAHRVFRPGLSLGG